MKNTALTSIHEALGAKMVPFAGYNMPVSYEGVTIEHETVRKDVGVFDVSHMGEFLISGPNALELIQKVSTNDASKLTDGKAQYSCLTNTEGGIVDDLIIYCLNPEKYLLVVNASNIEKDWDWISMHNTMEADMKDLSSEYSLLAIQGPKAVEAMQSLSPYDLSSIKFYNFVVEEFAGIENVIISATGYTGSGGFEIYCKNSEVEQVWNNVLEAGKEFGIKPIGLAARDTLRLEMGYCLYGNDINASTNPIEAGLGWITKLDKDNFIGKEALVDAKANTTRKLICIEMIDRGIPRKGYTIVNNGEVVGGVTSGTQSPSLNQGIGLAYVAKGFAKTGTKLKMKVRDKLLNCKVVKSPFYKEITVNS